MSLYNNQQILNTEITSQNAMSYMFFIALLFVGLLVEDKSILQVFLCRKNNAVCLILVRKITTQK